MVGGEALGVLVHMFAANVPSTHSPVHHHLLQHFLLSPEGGNRASQRQGQSARHVEFLLCNQEFIFWVSIARF